MMTSWMELAACKLCDPDLFYPTRSLGIAEAKRVCREECPVQEACLEYALDTNERHGIWGGTSERERRPMLRRRRVTLATLSA